MFKAWVNVSIKMFSGEKGKLLSQSVKSPISILQRAVRKHISIMLKDGLEYRGRMVTVDAYMNIVLRDATEYSSDTLTANYGRLVIRGSNILLVKLQDEF